MNEASRIAFVLNRDGEAQCKNWALSVYRIYRTGVYGNATKTAWMRSKDFRPKFLQSLLELRKFLNVQKE